MRRSARLAALGALLAVACFAAVSPAFSPPTLYRLDKLVHIAVFGVLALAAVRWGGGTRRALTWCAGFAMAGVAIEFAQHLAPHRSASVGDALANVIGLAAGFMAGVCWRSMTTAWRVPGLRPGA